MIRAAALAALPLCSALAAAQGTLLHHVKGAKPADRLGWSLATPGDLSGDGVPDVVVGVPYDPVDTVQKGSLQARSGASGALLYSLWGDAALDHAGWSLAGMGDLNSDGRGDYVYGLPDSDFAALDAGMVRVASGDDGATLFEFLGAAGGESFGHAVGNAGDVNFDGVPDVIVGAWRAASLGAGTGRVELRSGATGAFLRQHTGAAAGDRFGYAVCGLGDVDGDGRSDYAVGADQEGFGPGYVRVYSGATGSVIRTHTGTTPLARFGAAVAGAGDVDLDGRGDLAIGVPRELDGADRTGACVVRSGASGALLWSALGASHGAEFGHALAGGSDLDGDARPDLIVGAPLESGHGVVQVRAGLGGALLREFQGASGGERFGHAVGWAGLVDADGEPDLAIGVPREDPSGTDSGALRVYSGDGTACFPSTYCTAKLNSQGCAPQIGWLGSPTLGGADDFVVRATSVVNQKPGVMLWSSTPATVPFMNGWLCVAPPILRSSILLSGGNPPPDDCSGVLSLPLSHAFFAQQGWSAGTQVAMQAWSRDPAHPDGTAASLSDALLFHVCP